MARTFLGEDREDIVFRDPARGVYRRLVIQDNRSIGAVMYGDTADMRDTPIFGPVMQGGEPLDPKAAVAALPADAETCGCNVDPCRCDQRAGARRGNQR